MWSVFLGSVIMSLSKNFAKYLLKSEMIKRNISNEELTELMKSNGFNDTKASIVNKISRGTFSADFLIKVLCVIGCKKIDIEKHQKFLKLKEHQAIDYKNNTNNETKKNEN